MEQIVKSIEVQAPLSTVYNQWTQFEEFPRFMDGVQEVRQLDEKRLRWRANIAGKEETWTAEITLQEPDRVIAWRSTSGAPNAGEVRFQRIDDLTTEIVLTMSVEPQGAVEKFGEMIGLVDSRVERDLERFKEFIEKRQVETGAWRGKV